MGVNNFPCLAFPRGPGVGSLLVVQPKQALKNPEVYNESPGFAEFPGELAL
jgi:hypothetical protein